MVRSLAFCLFAAALAAPATAVKPQVPQTQDAHTDALRSAADAATRTADNRARDIYRHPAQTLAFFEVKPTDTVVEIWPGGGWYTEILAPYLKAGGGKLIAAAPEWGRGGIDKKKALDAALYGPVTVANFPVFDGKAPEVAPGSVDVVLTFRNVHNWRMGYKRDDQADYAPEAFRQIYAMLKPGGVLGIEDHRLPDNADAERERSSGYIKTSTVVAMAKAAGFELAGSSEINANPKDSADWPDGVWTLPPSFRLGNRDRAKYAAIGESDRMTLKFVKPR